MNRTHGPSILLGIGLGTLFTALLGMLFFLGYHPAPDDAEVLRRAAELGMVQKEDTQVAGVARQKDGSWVVIVSEKDTTVDLATRLVTAGLLTSELEFEIVAKSESLPDPPSPGRYLIAAGSGAKEVVGTMKNGPARE